MEVFFIKIERKKGPHAEELSRAMWIQIELKIIPLPLLLCPT